MSAKSVVRITALLAAVALAVPVLAKPISKSLTLTQPAKIGRTSVEAGDYRLLIDGTKVTVKRGKTVVAEVEGQWEQRSDKARYNSVVTGSKGELREVRFAGDRRVLVIQTQ